MSIVFGLLPIFRTARPDLIPALKDRTSSVSANRKEVRFRKVLVAVQIGFSLVLVVGSGLFSRSLSNLRHQNWFQTGNLTTFSVTAELSGYSAARGLALAEQIQARLKEVPDIRAISFAGLEPLSDSESLSNITVAGHESSSTQELEFCAHDFIGPEYFQTLGVPIVAGREFTLHDRYGLAKVVIVNESFARKYFPDGDPVGHLMKIGQDPSDPLDMTSKTRGQIFEAASCRTSTTLPSIGAGS
jgi:hypothetical protein